MTYILLPYEGGRIYLNSDKNWYIQDDRVYPRILISELEALLIKNSQGEQEHDKEEMGD